MASKTREKLIDVARQLFARKGVENTTMLDIANASDRGRRTIYTYFKNKREIHQAVLESESEQIVAAQRAILEGPGTWSDKLSRLLHTRFEVSSWPAGMPGGQPVPESETQTRPLIERFYIRRAQKTRRLAALKEVEILQAILDGGVEAGEFDAGMARRAVPLVVLLVQAFEQPSESEILTALGLRPTPAAADAVGFVLRGVRHKS